MALSIRNARRRVRDSRTADEILGYDDSAFKGEDFSQTDVFR